MALEHQIMVPCDDNLVPVGLFAQPLIEIDNLLWRTAECHEIAGMNQHVSIRHAQFGVLAVCIADAYNSYPSHRLDSLLEAFNDADTGLSLPLMDLSVPLPTLTLVYPARGSNW